MQKWSGALVALAIAGVGCHARPPAAMPSKTMASQPTAPVRPPSPPPPPAAVRAPATTAPLSEEQLFQRKSLADLNAEHPLGDAFFDYDQATLREDGKRLLQQDAAWLSKWKQVAVRVEGYCDERGTAEYNLALGERRASIVAEYLEGLGVSSARVQTSSLGKEQMFCHDSNESCWAQNRRGHFVITAK